MTKQPQKANNQNKNRRVEIFTCLGLTVLSSILFAASFPNLLFKNGLPFLAWFAYIPVLLIIRKNSILACAGWGAIYGCIAYSLFNYWLGAFHPLAGTIVYSIYLVYMAAVFALFKLADIFFPKKAYLVQWAIWLAYEYLRTKGFLGYPYGITGYSQWRIIPLIQIASITGVWGVSALVAFPSFWLASALKDFKKKNFTTEFHGAQTSTPLRGVDEKSLHGVAHKKLLQDEQRREGFSLSSAPGRKREEGSENDSFKEIGISLVSFFQKEKIPAIAWTAALVASLIFGIASNKDFSTYPKAQIALIQHNTDPWQASNAPTARQAGDAYRRDLAVLKRLSNEALSSGEKPQLVVWPETAFVPRIYWHTNYRDDQNSWLIVKELLEYLSTKDIPFLIGNDDARMEPAKNPNQKEKYRVDYNAAILFENGQITETYRKLRLVPFTEHFPYKKQLPFFYDWLEKADTHFWEMGDEETVFQGPGFSFSAPICFEDTFGYLSRNFVKRGADVLVNLSNDAWSKSLPAQNQHLSMAVFRAVENYRPMVRSTASGQTCAIDPRGRIIAMAAHFAETWLNEAIPIVSGNTIYTNFGDYFAIFFTFLAVILLLFGAISCTIRKIGKG